MKTSIRDKLEHLTRRLGELDLLLASETATQDMDSYRRLTREHAEIAPVVALFADFSKADEGDLSAQAMLADPEMKALAEEEIRACRERWRAWKANCRAPCCRAIRTTSATFSWKFAPAPAATSRRCSPATCSACMRATPSASAGRSKSSRRARPTSAATRR